jgi:hypothetical protein
MMDLTFSSGGRTHLSLVQKARLSVFSRMGRGNVFIQSGHIMTAARKQALRENAAKFDLDAELKKLKA